MSKKVVPMIHVPDVRATVDWYHSIGFNVVAAYGDETGEGLSFGIVSYGESEVMFNCEGETSTKRRREVDLYVYTDDVDELYSRLKDRVDIVEGPHDTFYGMREVIIRDLNRFWITFGHESVFAMLMNGVSEGKPELVRRAIDSGRVNSETLNVALAAALGFKKSDEVIELLRNAGATPPPEIAAETLQSYVGKYKAEGGLAAEITMQDGRLFATPLGQQPMSIWPLDQNTFKPIAISGTTIIFNVEDGKTVGLTLQCDDYGINFQRV